MILVPSRVVEPVAVTLIHWNQPERCLESTTAFGSQTVPVRLTIVDNASEPEKLAALRDGLGDVGGNFDRAPELVEENRNLGWGPGANVGLRRWLADDDPVEWAAVAPHDALPAPDCFERLLSEARIRPRAGLVSADVGDGLSPVIDRYFGPIARPAGRELGWEPVDYPHGTLFLLRRQCIDDVGLLDERYFAYCDEADLGERVRRVRWEVGLVRGARVHNPYLGGSERVVDYLKERNTLLLVRDNFGRYAATIRLMASLIQLMAGLVVPARRPLVFHPAARWRAIRDHVRGRYGPPPTMLTNPKARHAAR